jgi:hypothetical protein
MEGIVSGIISRPARAIALLAAFPLSGLGVGALVGTAYADDCLAAPNSAAPQGSHWYYRIDRVKKLKCWYLHALDEAGQQSAAGATPGIAPSVRLQTTDAQPASSPAPSIGAPISLIPADSARPVKKLAVKPQPVTNTVRNADAEPSVRQGSLAPSIPQARALQDPSQADGSNPITKSATLGATPDAHVEWSGRPAASIPQASDLQKDAPQAEGSNPTPMSAPPDATPNADGSGLEGSFTSPIPQTPALQKDASQADESNPTSVIGTSADPAEEVGEAYLMLKSADQAPDNAVSTAEATDTHALIVFSHKWNISSMGLPAAMPTGETIAILMFGMALVGMLSGVLLIIVETRRERVADHPESTLVNDRNQLDGRERDLEAALLANMMALARPNFNEPQLLPTLKRFNPRPCSPQ